MPLAVCLVSYCSLHSFVWQCIALYSFAFIWSGTNDLFLWDSTFVHHHHKYSMSVVLYFWSYIHIYKTIYGTGRGFQFYLKTPIHSYETIVRINENRNLEKKCEEHFFFTQKKIIIVMYSTRTCQKLMWIMFGTRKAEKNLLWFCNWWQFFLL